jgi:TonB-linked SusC/RagA family outer membrane protein
MEKMFRLMRGCKKNAHLRKIWMTMKLTIFLFFLAVSQMMAVETYSQSTRLSLNLQSVAVKDVLDQIEQKSEFVFLYNSKLIDVDRTVSLNLKDQKISDVLDKLFQEADVVYTIVDRQIVLTNKADQAGFLELSNVQQQKSISGKVTDSSGGSLPGVSVVVKGTTTGVITDGDGKYTIARIPENATLQFSFVGMKTQEFIVGNKTLINVTLADEAIGLEEVVAVGYGTMKKSDLTGAVSSVRIEDMDKLTKTSFDQALQGLAAGVMVTQNSSQPGGGINIRIRGIASINAGNEPLYVIDGVPIESSNISSGANFGPSISPLSSINPDDIQNVEILKDASSTAIYGARGSNGVVLITTKKGEVGDDKVVFSSSLGFQGIANNANLLNAQQYMDVVNQTFLNDNNGDESLAMQRPDYFTQAERDSIGNGNDWMDQILQIGTIQNYQLNASGGKKGLSYFLSAGHISNSGVVKNSNFKRTSVRINLQNQFTPKLTVGSNITVSSIKSDFIRTEGERTNEGVASVMYSAMLFKPTRSIYDENGGFFNELEVSNPLGLVELVTNSTNRLSVIGNIFAEYNLLNHLRFRTVGAFNLNDTRDNFYAPQKGTYEGSMNKGLARLGFNNTRHFTNTNSLNYSQKIGNHNINAMGVIELVKGDLYRVVDQVAGFKNDILREHDLSSGSNASKPNNYTQEYSLISYLTRINYNFKDRYLMTLSGRYDGSSRFGANNKFAFFPSASLGWNIANEDFFDNNFINQLKLRVGYGVAGNQNIALYSSTSPLVSDSYILGNNVVTGFRASRIANPDLRWEKKEQTNIGLDFGLFKGVISGALEYYNDVTNDLLLAKKIPTSSGYNNVMSNIGSIQNRGIEITLNTVNIDKRVKWRTNFNISFPTTKVKSLGDIDFMLAGYNSTYIKNSQILEVGKPIGQFYGFIIDGIAQTSEEAIYTMRKSIGDYKFRDISGSNGVPDGIISAAYDKTVIGNALPKFYGGITNTISYNGFELSFFFQGTYGNDIMNLNKIRSESSIPVNNLTKDALDSWTSENTNAKVRKLSYNNTYLDANSLYVEDGSYLRLKNITLNYDIPKRIVSSIGLSNIRLNISGQNLFVITKYSGMDPEVDAFRNGNLSFGHDYYGYPQSKIISTGLSVTF